MLTFRKKIKGFGLGGSLIALMALVVPASAAPLQASTDEPGRIVNGEDIDISDAPWQVALVFLDQAADEYVQFCGGSIYDESRIITAAHCFSADDVDEVDAGSELYGVVAGRTVLSGLTADDVHTVNKIVVNEDFVSVDNGDDVALLYLDDDPLPLAQNPETMQQIQLPTEQAAGWPSIGTEAFATGWGNTRHLGPGTDTLQGIRTEISQSVTAPVCGAYGTGLYVSLTFDPETMLCVPNIETEDGIAGGCQGDSGGPLAIEVGDDRYLAGITSWGFGCGNKDFTPRYSRLDPSRVLDTRVGNGGDGPIEPEIELSVDLADALPGDASAVVVNLTATGAEGNGYLTAYSCGDELPSTSNLNYVGVTTIANMATIDLVENRSICLQTGDAATDILVDLVGYFPDGGGYLYRPPERIVDTRTSEGGNGPVAADTVIEFEVAPDEQLAGFASAAVLNVTATGAEGNGYLTVYACDDGPPEASNLNYVDIDTIANTAITSFSNDGDRNLICIYVGDAATNILVDYVGLIQAGVSYSPLGPERVLSTRISDGGDGPIAAGDELRVPALPSSEKLPGDVPAAVAVNITATGAQGDGYLTAYACGDNKPDTSNLNYVGVTTIAGTSIVDVGDETEICIYVGDAATDILVDVVGVFLPLGPVNEGDFPSVYTRVTTYVEWIEDNLAMDDDR